jgi:hypothetical protein
VQEDDAKERRISTTLAPRLPDFPIEEPIATALMLPKRMIACSVNAPAVCDGTGCPIAQQAVEAIGMSELTHAEKLASPKTFFAALS